MVYFRYIIVNTLHKGDNKDDDDDDDDNNNNNNNNAKNLTLYKPRQALRPQGGWLGLQEFLDNRHMNVARSPTHRPPLPPGRYPWYSFLLEAESTPGLQSGRLD